MIDARYLLAGAVVTAAWFGLMVALHTMFGGV